MQGNNTTTVFRRETMMEPLPNSAVQYDNILKMICHALADNVNTNPEKSILIKASVKLNQPPKYDGKKDLEQFEVWVAGILR